MKPLPILLALLLAWLAVAGGYHLVGYPHFLGGGGPAPFGLIIEFPPAVPEAQHFGVAVALLGPLGLVLLAWLALWGFRQRRRGAYTECGRPALPRKGGRVSIAPVEGAIFLAARPKKSPPP